jgi:glycosyltransferase involved in cell wall biosynthesis
MPGPDDEDSRVVRVDDLVPTGPAVPGARTKVVGDLRPGSVQGRVDAVTALDRSDVVIVQHEYGIYGGPDGDEILDLLHRISAPCIVVLHTVLHVPSAHQRWLLERIAGLASAVVVMTHGAAELLTRIYAVEPGKVSVIPHGVASWPVAAPHPPLARPVLLTWGLISPGKGIEHAIRAMAELGDLSPRPKYRVLGQTHPKVLLDSGEAYRESLIALAHRLGVEDDVEIDGRYRGSDELANEVGQADVVLLPYDSRDQATSGVLAEALSAGKPVIATRFPHAIEVLSQGAGLLVGHEHPGEIADAVRQIVGRPDVVARMSALAHEKSAETSWPAVAAQYRLLADSLRQARAA